jgi:uncharacterized protein (DUF2249 family)
MPTVPTVPTAASPGGDHAQQTTMEAIRDHHARLARTMADHALTVRRSIDRLASSAEPQAAMVAFSVGEVLPHAVAEEKTLYAAGAELSRTRLLVGAMTREHTILRDLVGDLEGARTPGEAAGAATALNALFQAHLEKENDVLLPALVDAGVDLAALLEGMHEILGGDEHAAPEEHRCACGGHDAAGAAAAPAAAGELDARAIPHDRRHEQIFAAFRALTPGTAFTLVNDHDPRPLRHQFAERFPGEYTWDYVESGPVTWRVRIGRP